MSSNMQFTQMFKDLLIKNLECTFSKAECRRESKKFYFKDKNLAISVTNTIEHVSLKHHFDPILEKQPYRGIIDCEIWPCSHHRCT